MFATHEPFKLPFQLDEDSTIWRGIEVMMNAPWLLVTIEDEVEEVTRTFLLTGMNDLLGFVENSTMGRLTGVKAVIPPRLSPTRDWAFLSICRIERELRSVDGALPSAVLTATDGRRYGGFLIQPIERDDSDLILLVELPMAAT